MIRGRLGLPPAENEPLSRLVREAFPEGPAAPAVETLLRTLRPGLARVDRELEDLTPAKPGWREVLRGLLAPATVGGLSGAAAVVVLALVLLRVEPGSVPAPEAAPQPDTIASAFPIADDASPISDLQSESPLLVFEGDDGTTVIWVVEGGEDLSRTSVASRGDA